jgi:hypothetical protein
MGAPDNDGSSRQRSANRNGARRFLFAMFQGGGNIPLIMPIVAELVARGHDVRVLAGPGVRLSRLPVSDGWRKRMSDAGATEVRLAEPPVPPYESAPPLCGLAFGWMPKALVPYARDQARTTLWSSVWASNVTEQARVSPVDAVVADYWLPGAIAAAVSAGTPCAVIIHNAFPPKAKGQPPKGSGFMPARTPIDRVRHALWGWPYDRLWERDGLPAHNLARRELGLRPVRAVFDEFEQADRTLILGYKEFDFPGHLAANARYVGTPIDDQGASRDLWISPWPAGRPAAARAGEPEHAETGASTGDASHPRSTRRHARARARHARSVVDAR